MPGTGEPVSPEAAKWRPGRRGIVSLLALIACLTILGVAGRVAVFAFDSVSNAGIPTAVTTLVRLTSDTPGGLAQLNTINDLRLLSGRTLPAGAAINTTSAQLAGASTTAPVVGALLSCALLVGWSNGANVIDVVHCALVATNQP
jgi:hypothetical protein